MLVVCENEVGEEVENALDLIAEKEMRLAGELRDRVERGAR